MYTDNRLDQADILWNMTDGVMPSHVYRATPDRTLATSILPCPGVIHRLSRPASPSCTSNPHNAVGRKA